MRAELRGLDSPDAPQGLESFAPDDPECFSLGVTARIGPGGEDGEELFYFNVCSPRWLAEHPPKKASSLPATTSFLIAGATKPSFARSAICAFDLNCEHALLAAVVRKLVAALRG